MYRQILSTENEVASFYSLTSLRVEVGTKANGITYEDKDFVYCKRLKEFIGYVVAKRGIAECLNLVVKIGTDGGGKYLKTTLSICPKEKPDISTKNHQLSGVNKILLIGIMYDGKESNFNVHKMFVELGLRNPISFPKEVFLHGDLKIINKYIGVQEHSCECPCCYCTAKKDNLENVGEIRTLGRIRSQNRAWVTSGGRLKDLKLFESCVGTPVFDGVDDDATVEELIAPPELHLLIRIFNHLFRGLSEYYSIEMMQWAASHNCSPDAANGDFNGNSSKKLLSHVSDLKSIVCADLHYYVNVLSAFNLVVEACFGYDLADEWEERFDHLDYLLKKSKNEGKPITYFPSLHILMKHVPKFLSFHDIGLAVFSEQATESIHHKWSEFIANYKTSPTNSNFSTKILTACAQFNAQNL